MQEEKFLNISKKKLLLKTIGEILYEKRAAMKKGILLLSYEYDIPNSSIARLEKGERDVQITTLWKLANAFGMTFTELAREIENRMPKGFKLIDD